MKHRIKYSMILLACLLLVGNKNLAYAKGIEESLFSETKKEKGSITIQALEEESRLEPCRMEVMSFCRSMHQREST